MKDPKRYGFPMCECDATDEFHMEEMGMAELNDGGFVLWEDYAQLATEVEKLKGIILAQSSDFVRSKTAEESIKPDGHNDLAGRAVEHCLKLQAEVNRLTDALNKMTKTPDGVYGVDVKVNFWTKDGSRLPSSYQTFWTNEAKDVQS